MRQFVVGNNGVVCSSPAYSRTDGIWRTGGAVGAFDTLVSVSGRFLMLLLGQAARMAAAMLTSVMRYRCFFMESITCRKAV